MLFEEQIARKPNLYPWTDKIIHKLWDGFWTHRKISFKADKAQFKKSLSEDERRMIVRTLSAIGQIEVAVKTFWAKLGDNLPHPAIKDLGYVMANTEVIHNHAYEELLNVLGLSKVFQENLEVPVVQGRVKYLRKYQDKNYQDERKQYIYALILFTLFVENVSLFSQFYIILWFNKQKNQLKAIANQVQYTRNEEVVHAQVGIMLINTLREEYPELFDEELEARIKQECKDAYVAEADIIDWILNGFDEDGLSADVLKTFIQDRFNESMEQIGFDEIFVVDRTKLAETKWFKEELLANNATDFFDKDDTGYQKSSKSFDSIFEDD